jgi:HPt (histidine-containing phosphotransfer) domain-containing protein
MPELTATRGAVPAPSFDSPFDHAGLLDRVEGDTELLREIVELFLADCPRMLADVQAAIGAGDPVALRRSAHTLKGAAANFGATAVVALSLTLETIGKSSDVSDAGAVGERLEAALTALQAELHALLV